MSEFEWVTFDCYGTLIDWDEGIRAFLKDLLSRKKVSTNLEDLHQRWEAIQFELIQQDYRPYRDILRLSLEAVLRELNIPYTNDDGDAFVASMMTWQPFPDVPSALEELKRFARIAIISNTDNDILKESVKLIGVEFDALITAEDARTYKPDPRIFEFALRRLNEPPDRILHVAFGFKYDIAPAKRVGMRTCWLNRTSEPKPEGIEPDFTIKTMDEVVRIVAS